MDTFHLYLTPPPFGIWLSTTVHSQLLGSPPASLAGSSSVSSWSRVSLAPMTWCRPQSGHPQSPPCPSHSIHLAWVMPQPQPCHQTLTSCTRSPGHQVKGTLLRLASAKHGRYFRKLRCATECKDQNVSGLLANGNHGFTGRHHATAFSPPLSSTVPGTEQMLHKYLLN